MKLREISEIVDEIAIKLSSSSGKKNISFGVKPKVTVRVIPSSIEPFGEWYLFVDSHGKRLAVVYHYYGWIKTMVATPGGTFQMDEYEELPPIPDVPWEDVREMLLKMKSMVVS